MNIKETLYNACVEFIEQRFLNIQKTISDIQKSLLSETKSSAGDKHETGRAMLQLEREKAGHQLAEIQNVRTQLFKVDIVKSSEIIGLGSVVFTSQHNYFISVSAGRLSKESEEFYAISPYTPIGKLLIGKTVGDTIVFREQEFVIEQVI